MTGDTVVVPRIDRLARNLTEGLKTIEELHDKGLNALTSPTTASRPPRSSRSTNASTRSRCWAAAESPPSSRCRSKASDMRSVSVPDPTAFDTVQ